MAQFDNSNIALWCSAGRGARATMRGDFLCGQEGRRRQKKEQLKVRGQCAGRQN
jgi:hypothetical protein